MFSAATVRYLWGTLLFHLNKIEFTHCSRIRLELDVVSHCGAIIYWQVTSGQLVSRRFSFSSCRGRIQMIAYTVGICSWGRRQRSSPMCSVGTLVGSPLHAVMVLVGV